MKHGIATKNKNEYFEKNPTLRTCPKCPLAQIRPARKTPAYRLVSFCIGPSLIELFGYSESHIAAFQVEPQGDFHGILDVCHTIPILF
jgi:hypothetical protein